MSTLPPVAPAPVQLSQAPMAPKFGANNPFGNPLDKLDPQQVADKFEEVVRSHPVSSAALDIAKRLLAGDTQVLAEQEKKLLAPVNGAIEQVRAVAGDPIADQLQGAVNQFVAQAKKQAAADPRVQQLNLMVGTLPLFVEPMLEQLKGAVNEKGQNLVNPEVIEKLQQSLDQQQAQNKQVQDIMEEIVRDLPDYAAQLTEKATQLIDAFAGKLGLFGSDPFAGFGSIFGSLLGGKNTQSPQQSAPPEMTPEMERALKELTQLLQNEQENPPKKDN